MRKVTPRAGRVVPRASPERGTRRRAGQTDPDITHDITQDRAIDTATDIRHDPAKANRNGAPMSDRLYDSSEIQDRFAIMDLYDRQLAAAESFDFAAYDTTFARHARVDLSDFGQAECAYPEYRAWLQGLQPVMVEAQRITGGLRLCLEGDRATTRVPVACHVTMEIGGERRLTHTGLFYNDVLEKLEEGWRIVHRVEEKAWSA